VKAAGFDLVNDQIVGADGSTGEVMGIAASSPVKKRKSPAKKAADREPKKKPKVSEPTVDSVKKEDESKVKGESDEEAETNRGAESTGK
jgi:hypothetical protein